MAREIKFRAWDNNKNVMLYDVAIYGTGEGGISYDDAVEAYGAEGNLPDEQGDEWVFLLQHAFMQFTGIKDKNGKEIYEGDIVNYAVKRKICPICSKKEITSELTLGISRFCPECGTKVTDIDFVTTAKVVFDKGGFAYDHDVTEDTYQSWPTHAAEIYIEWVKVIGNIYDNPELLNTEQNVQASDKQRHETN